ADRLGPAVHGPRLRGGATLARHPALAVVRRRAAVQRRDRAVHADAEGAVPVAAPLHRPRPCGARDRGVHRALQPGVACGTSRPLHAARDPREATGGSVSRTGNCPGNPDRYTMVPSTSNLTSAGWRVTSSVRYVPPGCEESADLEVVVGCRNLLMARHTILF